MVHNTRHSRTLATFVAHQVRSYSRTELVSATSAQAVRVAVKNGTLVRVMHGIYVAGQHQDSFAARTHAAMRWAGAGAALTGQAALFLWQVLDEPPLRVQVAMPSGAGRVPPPWIRIVRTLAPHEAASWLSMPVVTAEAALVGCFSQFAGDTREALLFAGVRRGAISIQTLENVLAATPRMRERAELERLVRAISGGDESHLELMGSETVFTTAKLKGLLRQHKVRVDGQRFRLDYYDPATRTAFELDGAAFHGDLAARSRDIARDATLASHGILTVRFGYRDVLDRPEWCRKIATVTLVSRS